MVIVVILPPFLVFLLLGCAALVYVDMLTVSFMFPLVVLNGLLRLAARHG